MTSLRTYHDWRRSRESAESQLAAGRYNPALVAELRNGRKLLLSAGGDDSIDIFRCGDELLVLTINERYGYCGLEVFLPAANPTEYQAADRDLFLQSDDDIEAYLGRRGLDYSPLHVAKVLYLAID